MRFRVQVHPVENWISPKSSLVTPGYYKIRVADRRFESWCEGDVIVVSQHPDSTQFFCVNLSDPYLGSIPMDRLADMAYDVCPITGFALCREG